MSAKKEALAALDKMEAALANVDWAMDLLTGASRAASFAVDDLHASIEELEDADE